MDDNDGDAAMVDENGADSTAVPNASHVGSTTHSTSSGANATSTTQDSALRNTELHLLFGKSFSHPACRRRLLNVVLPQEVDPESDRVERSEDEHALLIGSLVDLNSNTGVRAAGALLQFADANRIGAVNVDGAGGCLVLEIRPLSIDTVVAIDETTFTALQIFAEDAAPTSGSRFGSWNKRREGLSLFGLVNAHCKSALGTKYLRYMFRCPPRNLSVILQRQEVVAFFANPAQNDLVKILQGHLRCIRNLSHLLKKIATTQALVRDWRALLKSMQSLLTVGEIAATEREGSIEILQSLRSSVTDELHAATEHLARIFDAEASVSKGRFCVNPGVDDELDQKRRVHNGLPDLLQKVINSSARRYKTAITYISPGIFSSRFFTCGSAGIVIVCSLLNLQQRANPVETSENSEKKVEKQSAYTCICLHSSEASEFTGINGFTGFTGFHC